MQVPSMLQGESLNRSVAKTFSVCELLHGRMARPVLTARELRRRIWPAYRSGAAAKWAERSCRSPLAAGRGAALPPITNERDRS